MASISTSASPSTSERRVASPSTSERRVFDPRRASYPGPRGSRLSSSSPPSPYGFGGLAPEVSDFLQRFAVFAPFASATTAAAAASGFGGDNNGDDDNGHDSYDSDDFDDSNMTVAPTGQGNEVSPGHGGPHTLPVREARRRARAIARNERNARNDEEGAAGVYGDYF